MVYNELIAILLVSFPVLIPVLVGRIIFEKFTGIYAELFRQLCIDPDPRFDFSGRSNDPRAIVNALKSAVGSDTKNIFLLPHPILRGKNDIGVFDSRRHDAVHGYNKFQLI